MHKLYNYLLLIALTVLTSCGGGKPSTQNAAVSDYAQFGFEPEPNTVYKVHPGGEVFLEKKTLYRNDGKPDAEIHYVSRPEHEGDSTYIYFHLSKVLDYVYDDQNRLSETTTYKHDSTTVLGRLLYTYQSDSVIRTLEHYDYHSGELLYTNIKDIGWFDGDKCVKLYSTRSTRNYYVTEEWQYNGDMLKKYSIDNFQYQDTVRFNEHVFGFSKKIVLFNEDGKPITDSVFRKTRSNEMDYLEVNHYDEYGTINKKTTYWSGEMKGVKWIPNVDDKSTQEITPNINRNTAYDPNQELNLLKSGSARLTNFKDPVLRDQIVRRNFEINKSGMVVAITDTFERKEIQGEPITRVRKIYYDDQNRVVKEDIEIDQVINGKRQSTLQYTYHPNGKLKMVLNREHFEQQNSGYTIFYADGSRKGVGSSLTSTTGIRDSSFTLLDSLRGNIIGKVRFANGKAMDGYYKFHDNAGRLIRDFNEEEYYDIQYTFTKEGDLISEAHYYFDYNQFLIGDKFQGTHLKYTLVYGKKEN